MTTEHPVSDPDNVVPPNELDRRRRVMACIEELGDLHRDYADRVRELRELGVPATDWLQLLSTHFPEYVQVLYQKYGSLLAGMVDGFLDARAANAKTGVDGLVAAFAGSATRSLSRSTITDYAGANAPVAAHEVALDVCLSFEGMRMQKLVERLFAEAPKMTDGAGNPDPTQAPALQCHVMLKAGGSMQGALSVTPEGTLRMLAMNKVDNRPVMVEHFFDYEQIADVAIFREVKATEGSRIVTS